MAGRLHSRQELQFEQREGGGGSVTIFNSLISFKMSHLPGCYHDHHDHHRHVFTLSRYELSTES